jgi:hypothetical protein
VTSCVTPPESFLNERVHHGEEHFYVEGRGVQKTNQFLLNLSPSDAHGAGLWIYNFEMDNRSAMSEKDIADFAPSRPSDLF